MKNENLATLLGIKYPIFLAGMAGETNPLMVAEFCNAGGLGGLGCARMSPREVTEAAEDIRKLTDKPFNLNFFCFNDRLLHEASFNSLPATLKLLLKTNKISVGNLPDQVKHFSFNEEMLRTVSRIRPAVVSFHFGPPSRKTVDALHDMGCKIFCTATTDREAIYLVGRGIDVVIAQSIEAGGHQGTFLGNDSKQGIGAMSLIPQIADAVDVPVIAAGGIADGRQMAAAMILGASGVQLGTAFLSTPEAGISEAYRVKILSVKMGETVISKAYSGKPARMVRNDWVDYVDKHLTKFAPFPFGYSIGEKLRPTLLANGEIAGDNDSHLLGQSSPMNRQLPTAELVKKIIDEFDAASMGLLVDPGRLLRGSG